MATTSVTVKIDENLKNQAEKLFEEMGLDMSTAVTLFLKAAIRQRRIPFEITADAPEAETVRAVRNAGNDTDLSRTIAELLENLDDGN